MEMPADIQSNLSGSKKRLLVVFFFISEMERGRFRIPSLSLL
jgi:hypothetical protein